MRKIRGIIYSNSFNDKTLWETVSWISRRGILELLHESELCISDVPDVEKGEVLADSRGRGSFQRLIKNGEGQALD